MLIDVSVSEVQCVQLLLNLHNLSSRSKLYIIQSMFEKYIYNLYI